MRQGVRLPGKVGGRQRGGQQDNHAIASGLGFPPFISGGVRWLWLVYTTPSG